jgi:hypothetical protein
MPYYLILAEIAGLSLDSLRNEGTREMYYGSCISASRSDRFTPGLKAPGTHWIGGWVGPRTSLDVVVKRNILPLPGIQPRPWSDSCDGLDEFTVLL